MPDADRGGAITEEVYNNYHKVLYPSILKQVDEYILPTLEANGEIHLGLGFMLKSDNHKKKVRSINNALNQFWSILTAIAINEIHYQIDKAGYKDDIIVTSTIYDSIYFDVKDDPTVVKWLNDTIIPIMSKDFMIDQPIHNDCDLCVGTAWSVEDIELPHNATLDEITQTLTKLKGDS
jgi:hypothetical protein